MGRELIQDKYKEIIKDCCLEQDIENIINGDQFIVSDRGSTLSGGQKARICLARALYSDRDIYLFDDPLSSLDCRVSKQLFNQCLLQRLANKTRMIVMRDFDYLKYADKILVLDQGNMTFYGSFLEFQNSFPDIDFSQFMITNKKSSEAYDSILSKNYSKLDAFNENEVYIPLTSQTYFKYFLLGFKSKIILFVTILMILFSGAIFIYFTYLSTRYIDDNSPILIFSIMMLAWYGSIIFLHIPFTYFLGDSNIGLHENASTNLSKFSLKYFDENPPGVILNKFTKDMALLDRTLMQIFQEAILWIPLFLITILLLMISQPVTIITISFFIAELILITKYVLPVVCQLRRLGIIINGPIVSITCAILSGLTTIRSLNIQSFLNEKMRSHSNLLYRLHITIEHFVMLYAGTLELGFMFITLINIAIIMSFRGYFSTEISVIAIGTLMISMNFSLASFFLVTKVDSCMLSAHYLLTLSELPTEHKVHKGKKKELLVENGKIEFSNLCVNYGEKHALKDLKCVIKPNSKVGIIGRTGAGKSTIFKVLLKLIEPHSGTIHIDDKDYMLYTAKAIRRSISTSPQSSLIFYGSIRENLDPLNIYSSYQLISTLEMLGLKSVLDKELDDTEFGKNHNLSIGEKQLFCLARIILKKTKIVLIDEGTSSMDPHTDQLIQDTIQKELNECTILTISHRLNTIKNYEYILIVDSGMMIEYGLQNELLLNPSSHYQKIRNELV